MVGSDTVDIHGVHLMSGLFPKAPTISAARQAVIPACEWVMPASAVRRRDYFSTYKALPGGMPDCLQVNIIYSEEGTERCTAAIYGGHPYVIHYEFNRHGSA
jgi:hypothetical protein